MSGSSFFSLSEGPRLSTSAPLIGPKPSGRSMVAKPLLMPKWCEPLGCHCHVTLMVDTHEISLFFSLFSSFRIVQFKCQGPNLAESGCNRSQDAKSGAAVTNQEFIQAHCAAKPGKALSFVLNSDFSDF